jgi:large subunit ribosomal protein L6
MKKINLYNFSLIKIPKTVDVIYCKKKSILIFKGFLKTKTLQINNKIILIPSKNCIIVTSFLNNDSSILSLKKAKIMKGTYIAKIKDILVEVNYHLYRKLNFVGVGYRAFFLENLDNQLYFKLGYSHLIYFKIPQELKSYCIKYTKLFIFGNVSYELVNQTISQIRQCKTPEPYKGKGILYDGEKIKLKKGKKI